METISLDRLCQTLALTEKVRYKSFRRFRRDACRNIKPVVKPTRHIQRHLSDLEYKALTDFRDSIEQQIFDSKPQWEKDKRLIELEELSVKYEKQKQESEQETDILEIPSDDLLKQLENLTPADMIKNLEQVVVQPVVKKKPIIKKGPRPELTTKYLISIGRPDLVSLD